MSDNIDCLNSPVPGRRWALAERMGRDLRDKSLSFFTSEAEVIKRYSNPRGSEWALECFRRAARDHAFDDGCLAVFDESNGIFVGSAPIGDATPDTELATTVLGGLVGGYLAARRLLDCGERNITFLVYHMPDKFDYHGQTIEFFDQRGTMIGEARTTL